MVKVAVMDRHLLYELAKLAVNTDSIELLDGELGEVKTVSFEITDPYKDLEPYEQMVRLDRYTGKCKKLRREARGW